MRTILFIILLLIFQTTILGQGNIEVYENTYFSKIMVLLILGLVGTLNYFNWIKENRQPDP